MIPYHEVHDAAKVERLAASIDANGWQGAPLVVVDGEFLITGVHRYAACRKLYIPDNEIPTIELSDVFAEAGIDLDAALSAEGYPAVGEPLFEAVVLDLPHSIREKYGLDLG